MISKRQLKSKIQATSNIKQMTRAMELVAATKMRKAQDRALKARPYAKHALSLLSRIVALASLREQEGTLWQERTEGKVCLVVVTSDKGLSGSFNSAVLRLSLEKAQEYQKNGEAVEVAAVGKKAHDFFLNRSIPVTTSFLRFSDIVGLEDARPLADWVLNAYAAKIYKEVVFCSTQFVSALINHAQFRQLRLCRPRLAQPLVERRWRDCAANPRQGAVRHPPRGAAVHALESRYGSQAAELCAFERDPVGEMGGPVPAVQQHRRAAAHGVDDTAIGREAGHALRP